MKAMRLQRYFLHSAVPLLALFLASGCVIDRRIDEAPSVPGVVEQMDAPLYEVADAYVSFAYAPPVGPPYGGLDDARVAYLRIYENAALLTLPDGEWMAVPFAKLHDGFHWRPVPRPAAPTAESE